MYYVLTYDAPHRKTQDLLFRLKVLGYADILVVAAPWRDLRSPSPLIPHRPANPVDVSAQDLCRRLGYDFVRMPHKELGPHLQKHQPDSVLIAGAGILPADVVEGNRVINAHPGYLPNVRGLDALKWAIHDGHPIGVTTHVVSREADAGLLLKRATVPVYRWDTFHSLAYRQYEIEIAMLADAITDVRHAGQLEPIDGSAYPVHSRMSHAQERQMLARFQDFITRLSDETPSRTSCSPSGQTCPPTPVHP